jgi:beta-glucosidase
LHPARPVRELKGFERIALAPGEKKTVRFSLGQAEPSFWSSSEKAWIRETENFDLWVGPDSTAAVHAAFRVTP